MTFLGLSFSQPEELAVGIKNSLVRKSRDFGLTVVYQKF